MPMAVGVIETLSFPAILIASDTMVKAAAVSIVFYDKSESGRSVSYTHLTLPTNREV